MVTIPGGSESDLQAATATAGPISIAIDGSSNAFRVSQVIRTSKYHVVISSLIH